MTDKEINRATINAFLARCINRGAASAIDAEFGLRVVGAEVNAGNVRIQFEGGAHVVICPPAILERPTRGGPTEQFPDAPYCKPDQSCCDFCCGN